MGRHVVDLCGSLRLLVFNVYFYRLQQLLVFQWVLLSTWWMIVSTRIHHIVNAVVNVYQAGAYHHTTILLFITFVIRRFFSRETSGVVHPSSPDVIDVRLQSTGSLRPWRSPTARLWWRPCPGDPPSCHSSGPAFHMGRPDPIPLARRELEHIMEHTERATENRKHHLINLMEKK